MKRDAPLRAFCEGRKSVHQFRALTETTVLAEGRISRDNQTLINFSSNDYLGLSHHPALVARARACVELYGTGSTASRLITGNSPLYSPIETKLARGKKTEASLVFASGTQANMTVLPALLDREVLGRPVTVLADRLCHHSLLQGILLSGARLQRFHHNDYEHLETLLRQQDERGASLMIVSESVFGMDGDRADLAVLAGLAQRYEARLYIDEAHATGVFGPDGFGLGAEHPESIDVVMGTFGKALGSFGAYVACSAVIREYLLQRCGGMIYSTALPPSVLGSMDAALDLLPDLGEARASLLHQATRLREALQQQGWNCGGSSTQIIPIILGQEQDATALARQLQQAGLLVPAIRPPTVPRGTSRLRISLSAAHSAVDVDHLIKIMAGEANHYTSQRALAS